MTIDFDETLPSLVTEEISPTGPALLALVQENITTNFVNNNPTSIDLPSLWRLAKHVTSGRGPILVYSSK